MISAGALLACNISLANIGHLLGDRPGLIDPYYIELCQCEDWPAASIIEPAETLPTGVKTAPAMTMLHPVWRSTPDEYGRTEAIARHQTAAMARKYASERPAKHVSRVFYGSLSGF